ncbi:hypothetical protein VNN36_08925 [Lactococcus garvieae]
MKKIILPVVAAVFLSLGAVFFVYRGIPQEDQAFKTSEKIDFYIMSSKKL